MSHAVSHSCWRRQCLKTTNSKSFANVIVLSQFLLSLDSISFQTQKWIVFWFVSLFNVTLTVQSNCLSALLAFFVCSIKMR